MARIYWRMTTPRQAEDDDETLRQFIREHVRLMEDSRDGGVIKQTVDLVSKLFPGTKVDTKPGTKSGTVKEPVGKPQDKTASAAAFDKMSQSSVFKTLRQRANKPAELEQMAKQFIDAVSTNEKGEPKQGFNKSRKKQAVNKLQKLVSDEPENKEKSK